MRIFRQFTSLNNAPPLRICSFEREGAVVCGQKVLAQRLGNFHDSMMNDKDLNLRKVGLVTISIGLLNTGHAQELAPDDPAIESSLGVWFQDAENLFDSESGIWSDSSGNGNDASPVGMVNVGGPITYLAPTSSTVSGGSFSDSDLPAVRFSAAVEDLLEIEDINGGAGLSNLTIFAVYNVDQAGANEYMSSGWNWIGCGDSTEPGE